MSSGIKHCGYTYRVNQSKMGQCLGQPSNPLVSMQEMWKRVRCTSACCGGTVVIENDIHTHGGDEVDNTSECSYEVNVDDDRDVDVAEEDINRETVVQRSHSAP